ncbi:MAG: hypothetical protein LAO30_13865 [Acidobacteriia bacterium]|nr:hypothetical protein [Terriglobia bacterium]
MNTALWVAVIGALATLIAATITHFLARRREYQLRELQFKLDRYVDFLGGFAEFGSATKSHEVHLRIASAVNVMNLIASREVLEQVYRLFDYIRTHKDGSYSIVEQDEIIRQIILAIRGDLGQTTADIMKFQFRVISPGV